MAYGFVLNFQRVVDKFVLHSEPVTYTSVKLKATICGFFRGEKMSHRIEHHAGTGDRIVGIAQSTEAASIGLLAAIDGTVEAMVGVAQIMAGMAKVVGSAGDEIKSLSVIEGQYIDPDDIAIDAMERSERQLDSFLRRLVLKRSAIDKDGQLKDHHCEALHDAYDAAMTEVAELIELLADCRSAIIAYDLKAEPRSDSESYDTVDALIAGLRTAS